MIKQFLVIILLFAQAVSAQELKWPEVTRVTKPWTRWWWPGSIVSKEGLTYAMEKYMEAGLGGLEITVIYGVKGEEDKFINYLSPSWMDMFTHALNEAGRLDLGIDLANASGWPFGGPWVEPEDACRNINLKTWNLNGGDSLVEKVEFIQSPLIRTIGPKPDISDLKYPVSRNTNLQLYAFEQIRFERPLPLTALMAYSGKGEVISLTRFVTQDGKLHWIAPDGTWTLYGLFEGWHGKQVERAGPGGEGDVIDHFSAQAVRNYLNRFDEAFGKVELKNLRGFFNDSYEVDDASGQADWTNDLFYEFSLRRGYDLREHLPALFQKDSSDKNARVLSDFRQTISDLLLEKLTTNWTVWAHRKGKTTRDQAHGSPGNILDLYAASDIPETEGDEITRFKFASSAANVTGKPLVSCEAATWLNEHFVSSLSDVKSAADKFFLGGVNHLFYHGTCYSPKDEPWPGFLFYAATEFTPANPLWDQFKGLNDYITRIQSFLQQGMSENDILLYFPVYDGYACYDRGLLEHFDGIGRAFDGSIFKSAAETMINKGFSFDFISDLQLKNTNSYGELLQTEGNIYKVIVIPECTYIPVETFSQILKLANDGSRIIFLGNLPEKTAGWAEKDEKTLFFTRMKESIRFTTTNNPAVLKAVFGKGMILNGNDIEQLLAFAGIRRETMTDNDLACVRRQTMTGTVYFIVNNGKKVFDGWLPLEEASSNAAVFNPIDGSCGLAKSRTTASGIPEVYLKLHPRQSLIINTYDIKPKGRQYIFFNPAAAPSEIKGRWKIEFIDGGPSIPSAREVSELVSWTVLGGDDLRFFSGTAKYTIAFDISPAKADSWLLDLGRVCESARLKLNGKDLAILIGPEFSINIDSKLLQKHNTLEVFVSNLMANRIAYLDKNNIQWKKFYNVNMSARLKQNIKNGVFNASGWDPKDSGLLGPVTITPVKSNK